MRWALRMAVAALAALTLPAAVAAAATVNPGVFVKIVPPNHARVLDEQLTGRCDELVGDGWLGPDDAYIGTPNVSNYRGSIEIGARRGSLVGTGALVVGDILKVSHQLELGRLGIEVTPGVLYVTGTERPISHSPEIATARRVRLIVVHHPTFAASPFHVQGTGAPAPNSYGLTIHGAATMTAELAAALNRNHCPGGVRPGLHPFAAGFRLGALTATILPNAAEASAGTIRFDFELGAAPMISPVAPVTALDEDQDGFTLEVPFTADPPLRLRCDQGDLCVASSGTAVTPAASGVDLSLNGATSSLRGLSIAFAPHQFTASAAIGGAPSTLASGVAPRSMTADETANGSLTAAGAAAISSGLGTDISQTSNLFEFKLSIADVKPG